MTTFREKHTFDQRKNEATRILTKYPDRIPVVVEIDRRSKLKLDRHKYLTPAELTCGQFIYVLRKRLKLAPEKSLFMFFRDNKLPPTSALMGELYKEYMDNDFFLTVTIAEENTFGVNRN